MNSFPTGARSHRLAGPPRRYHRLADGPPRLMVGPVARGYEAVSPIAERLDDVRAARSPGHSAPWRASYMVEDDRPRVRLRPFSCEGDPATYDAVDGAPEGSELALTLLDHHGDALSAPSVGRGGGAFAFAPTTPNEPEGVHVMLRTAEGRRYDWVTSDGGEAEKEAAAE